MANAARYVAIGSSASQRHVVQPPWVLLSSRLPFAIASRPSGTVISNVKLALSVGWSFAGNHVEAPCGSPRINTPSSVRRGPDTPRASLIGFGMPP